MVKSKNSEDQEFLLMEDDSRTERLKGSKQTKKLKILIYSLIIVIAISIPIFLHKNNNSQEEEEEEDIKLVYIKGYSRKDKYGLELNSNVLDGIYCVGFDNDPNKAVEDWKLYTPPCPYLHPVHYPDSILNPKCDEISIQLINYENEDGGLPYSLHLKSITDQIKNWKKFEKKNGDNPYYGQKRVNELVDDKYYPYDYGYNGEDTSDINDDEFYKNVINSRMDEVPDPRRRRLFSFILFNSEYDLLDLYLSEYYEIFDYFVIYESNMTFTGTPKPLYFTRALLETDRYDKYKDKLIPLPLKIEVNEDNGRGYAFPREHVARRLVVAEGLKSVQARHGDIFMHGDLDEMVKPHVIARLKKCGGWEHLQAGIGGGPKSFKNDDVETYFKNENLVQINEHGQYNVDYLKDMSIGFQSWFYEYSFNIIQNKKAGTIYHPNIALFDAKRSLGQLPDRVNRPSANNKKKRREYEDPLLDPNFDPYQGYMYTNNTNDLHTGKGFLGEFVRFASSLNFDQMKQHGKPAFWNAAWHLSSFLPTIEQIYNKVSSYSHLNDYHIEGEEAIKNDIMERIKNHEYIFGPKNKYEDNIPILPKNYTKGYEYNFSNKYWDDNLKNSDNPDFINFIDVLDHEIPNHIWQNPICYSYMLDRDYGMDKKIWWQVIPREQWKYVRFEELNETLLNELIPPLLSETFKTEMIEELKKQDYLN